MQDASLIRQSDHRTLDGEKVLPAKQEIRHIFTDGGERSRSRIREEKVEFHGSPERESRKKRRIKNQGSEKSLSSVHEGNGSEDDGGKEKVQELIV